MNRKKSKFSIGLSASFPHGSVRVDESNITHFVADDLEYKIKIASPTEPSEGSASNQLQRQFLSSVPQIDANALNDIELEAQYLAANIDGITENLCNLLHSVGFDLKQFHHQQIDFLHKIVWFFRRFHR